jgi:Trypsin-co-occurring domain 1
MRRSSKIARQGVDVADRRLVMAGGAEFYAEVVDVGGPTTIRDESRVLSFDGVRDTIEGIAADLAKSWEKAKPSEASVEFGLKLTAKSGKLTGLIVEGGGEANLRVTLTWRRSDKLASSG